MASSWQGRYLTDPEEKMEGLKIITDNIIKGRWEEVPVGSENELKATMVVKFIIEKASVKIRNGGPQGDEDKDNAVWSGHIPLTLRAEQPVFDVKFGEPLPMCNSVKNYWNNNQ